jgi:hypothetical protein
MEHWMRAIGDSDGLITLWNPGTDWDALSGTLSHNAASTQIQSMSFHLQDPRVILIPVTDVQVSQLGCRVYPVSSDPFKFQDAVVIGTRENYYGECSNGREEGRRNNAERL